MSKVFTETEKKFYVKTDHQEETSLLGLLPLPMRTVLMWLTIFLARWSLKYREVLIKILWRLKFFTFGTLLWDITVFKLGTTFEVKQSGTENFYTFGSLSYLSICIFVKNQNPYFSSHMLPIGGLRDGLWMQSLATHAFNYQLVAFNCFRQFIAFYSKKLHLGPETKPAFFSIVTWFKT